MTDKPLTPARHDDVHASISDALRFEGRRRHGRADSPMADIVAELLLKHLEESYIIMQKPPRWEGLPDAGYTWADGAPGKR